MTDKPFDIRNYKPEELMLRDGRVVVAVVENKNMSEDGDMRMTILFNRDGHHHNYITCCINGKVYCNNDSLYLSDIILKPCKKLYVKSLEQLVESGLVTRLIIEGSDGSMLNLDAHTCNKPVDLRACHLEKFYQYCCEEREE